MVWLAVVIALRIASSKLVLLFPMSSVTFATRWNVSLSGVRWSRLSIWGAVVMRIGEGPSQAKGARLLAHLAVTSLGDGFLHEGTKRKSMSPTRMETTAQARMHDTRHALDKDVRRAMVTMLNHRLADASDLYSHTKHAHWNVKGMNFIQFHRLFDELAEKVERHVDEIAERATALGGSALGTTRMVAQGSSLDEFPLEATTGHACIEALSTRYALHAKKIIESVERAEESGDIGTADLLTGMARELDEALYLLESHLQA